MPTEPTTPIRRPSSANAASQRLEHVDKIAVLRANRIGDFIFTLPALDALRQTYPRAEIVLLARPWHADFLARRPGPVDRVVAVPASRGVHDESGREEDPGELERFFSAMQAERFDLALQMHGGGRHSNPFVARLGARTSVGSRAPDAPALDRCVHYVPTHHEVLRYLEVAALAGAGPAELEPRLAPTREDLEEAAAAVPGAAIDPVAPGRGAPGRGDGRPLAVLHPGAIDPRRRWPAERFAAVGDALARAGARVVLTGTPEERAPAASVAAAMTEGVEDATATGLSLRGLAGLLSASRVVVSNDSGPLHLAAAVGAATVGIYWWRNFLTGAPLTRTRHRPAVSMRVSCPACGADCSNGEMCPAHAVSFVDWVPEPEVRESALDLLAG